MKRVIIVLAVLAMLVACNTNKSKSKNNYSNPKVAELPIADISAYRNMKPVDLVKQGSLAKVIELYQEGGTMIFYAGQASCINCLEFFPVLVEVAKEYNIPIVYVDLALEVHPAMNPDFFLFMEVFDKYLEVDDDGDKDLFMPYTVFVKDGKVVDYHIGGAENYDPKDGPMSDNQIIKLKKSLGKGFDKVGK